MPTNVASSNAALAGHESARFASAGRASTKLPFAVFAAADCDSGFASVASLPSVGSCASGAGFSSVGGLMDTEAVPIDVEETDGFGLDSNSAGLLLAPP
ncbi:hypothetical protein [Paractinoplanes ferrugineus]|uniref:hypothetical protein n=1 Tax=Paractinoplanes ferrugineus TaxID=113564 RepID=UPI0019418CF8|nr:hypothetical protein [Actinoplanes ferrugineus]